MKRAVTLLPQSFRNFTSNLLLFSPKLHPFTPLTTQLFGLSFFSSESKSYTKPNFVSTNNPNPPTVDITNQNKEFKNIIESLKQGNKEAEKEISENNFKRGFDYDELWEDFCEKTNRDDWNEYDGNTDDDDL